MCEASTPLLDERAEAHYTYLLGIYLGDGYIARVGRTRDLRIYLDAAYPGIVVESCEAIFALLGKWARINRRANARMFVIHCYSRHWPILFPQHGPGRKHERPIRLASWQRDVVSRHHALFVRGLIHSDGSRYRARQRTGGKDYFYDRYSFSNRSVDIRKLFCESLRALGVHYDVVKWNVDVNRRADVASLDEFVGPKR